MAHPAYPHRDADEYTDANAGVDNYAQRHANGRPNPATHSDIAIDTHTDAYADPYTDARITTHTQQGVRNL